MDAKAHGVVVPETLEEYCVPINRRASSSSTCQWNNSLRSSFDVEEEMVASNLSINDEIKYIFSVLRR